MMMMMNKPLVNKVLRKVVRRVALSLLRAAAEALNKIVSKYDR